MQTNIELTEPETQGLQKILGGLSKREYLHRCAVWGIQHPELIHDADKLKELKIAQPVQPTANASTEPELPNPDLIEGFENCIYLIKKNDSWDQDKKDKDTRILRDIRKLWEIGKVSNVKFEAAIDKVERKLVVDQQAAATKYRLSRLSVFERLKGYMTARQRGFFEELTSLLKHLEEVSASGKQMSDADFVSTNRIEYLTPFYETDRTLAELETDVMAVCTDYYLDNDPFVIYKKLDERMDLISWVMKKLAADGKLRLNESIQSM